MADGATGSPSGGSSGTLNGGNPSPPTPDPSAPALRQSRWQRWREPTIKAALIGAAGTILGAGVTGVFVLVGESANPGEAASKTLIPTSPIPKDAWPRPMISLASWSISPGPTPSSKTYTFTGTAADTPDAWVIHVIIEKPTTNAFAPSGDDADAQWLVSPKADRLRNGRWKVSWTIDNPPGSGNWRAVIVNPIEDGDRQNFVAQPPATIGPIDRYYIRELKFLGVYSGDVMAEATLASARPVPSVRRGSGGSSGE